MLKLSKSITNTKTKFHNNMDNQNFTLALVDKNLNMFKSIEHNRTQTIANIIEHEQRIDEFSPECQFFIDEHMYRALGNQGVPFKFTKVFVANPDAFQQQKYCKFFDIKEFNDNVRKYNNFDKHKPLFFAGGTKFLECAMKVSSKLLLTVVDTIVEDAVEAFPLEVAQSIFKGRKTIEPILLEQIKQYKKDMLNKRSNTYEIGDNGMKIMKEPETQKFSDAIMNTPNYIFYEYRR